MFLGLLNPEYLLVPCRKQEAAGTELSRAEVYFPLFVIGHLKRGENNNKAYYNVLSSHYG